MTTTLESSTNEPSRIQTVRARAGTLAKRVSVVLFGTALVLGLTSIGTAPAAAAYSPTNSVVFNNPKGSKSQQEAIINAFNKSVDVAPKGSTIKIAQFIFNIPSTNSKLIKAYKRGVNVQMLIDDGKTDAKEVQQLMKALGTDKTKKSFVTTCHRGCMSNTASIMHAKFFLFSQAGKARNVSMISSANLFSGNTYTSWNNMHTIVNDAKMFASLDKYFVDMIKDKNTPNYYRTTTSGKNKIYLYPRAPAPNYIVLLDVLNHVKCTKPAKGYGQNGRTVIRVAQWGWTAARYDIARKLWALHNSGCTVEVIINTGTSNVNVMKILLKKSKKYGQMRVFDAWKDGNRNGKPSLYIHHKLLTVNGVWFGHKNTKVTYTGSQNYTGQGTTANNDMILRVVDNKIHDAYVKNFRYIRDKYSKRLYTVPTNIVKRVPEDGRVKPGVELDESTDY